MLKLFFATSRSAAAVPDGLLAGVDRPADGPSQSGRGRAAPASFDVTKNSSEEAPCVTNQWLIFSSTIVSWLTIALRMFFMRGDIYCCSSS